MLGVCHSNHHLFNRLLQCRRNITRCLSFEFYLGIPSSKTKLRTQIISSFPCGSGLYATCTGSAFTSLMLQLGSGRWEDWLRSELPCCFAGAGNNRGIQFSGQHGCQGKLPTQRQHRSCLIRKLQSREARACARLSARDSEAWNGGNERTFLTE